MQALIHDLRYSVRMLRKHPGFAFVAVVTLALGIGVNAAIFSVVDSVLWRPLPYSQPERLAILTRELPDGSSFFSMPVDVWREWREQGRLFERVEAHVQQTLVMTGGPEPEEMLVSRLSPGMLPLLGMQPTLGRAFVPEDAETGNDRVLLLSHALWRSHFGGAADVVGKTITLNEQPWTIIGVMPPRFAFPRKRVQMWAPLAPADAAGRKERVDVVVRLREGLGREEARAELRVLSERLDREKPSREGWGAGLMPMDRFRVNPGPRRALLLLLGAVGFVLLIACANAANLLLARAATRERELAVRAALGAGRWRLIRQLLAESLLLSFIAGAAGVLLALWCVEILARLTPPELTFLLVNDIDVNSRALLFTIGLSALTGILCGLAPALRMARPDLHPLLKGQARSATADRRQNWLRQTLVVVEVGLSIVLLIGAGLMIRSFLRLQQVSPGYEVDRLLAMTIAPSPQRYAAPELRRGFYDQLRERVAALPGVASVSLSGGIPPVGAGFSLGAEPEIEGRGKRKHPEELLPFNSVDAAYFQTMGIPLLRGRGFNAEDLPGAPRAIIVNDRMARYYWPGEDPIGRRIRFSDEAPWMTVVGVAGDVKAMGPADAMGSMEYYTALSQRRSVSEQMTFAIRTSLAPESLFSSIRDAVRAVDPKQPVYRLETAARMLDESLAESRFYLLLMTVFAGSAMLLAAIGLYGVLAFLVTQRTREIGVRMALGAQSRDVMRLVLGQGMRLTLGGLALGLVAALALTRLLKAMLFGVSATDPLTFAIIALLLPAVALLACYLPARRATRVDPLDALRCE